MEMPFGLWLGWAKESCIRWESTGAEEEEHCHGNQLWDAICYNWLFWLLVGNNFGCMIASDMLFMVAL